MLNLKDLTLKEKIGQMIGLAFSGSEYSKELEMQIEDIEAGLIIYFKDNNYTYIYLKIFNLLKTIVLFLYHSLNYINCIFYS